MHQDEESTITTIILESRNDRDISQADLNVVARDIRGDLQGAFEAAIDVVAVAQPALGVGSQWSDVLHVFLPSADFLKDAAWTIVLGRIEEFMRRRFSRKHEASRPRVIVIRESHDGQVLNVRELNEADGDFITKEDVPDDPRLPPPAT